VALKLPVFATATKRLGLSDEEENALVSFMQTLNDGFMQR